MLRKILDAMLYTIAVLVCLILIVIAVLLMATVGGAIQGAIMFIGYWIYQGFVNYQLEMLAIVEGFVIVFLALSLIEAYKKDSNKIPSRW